MSSTRNEENWKLISLKIPLEMLEEWDKHTNLKGMKRSEFIRWCVNNEIHPDEKKDESLINLTDQIIKLYVGGLERRVMFKFQRLEALLLGNLNKYPPNQKS